MNDTTSNTDAAKKKRLVKNTGLLYIRMLLTMAISLYTSRVVLKQLGVHDYGIYNVVGGIVTMFSILSSSLSASISRFLTYELGRGNISNLKRIFSTSLYIQIAMGTVIAILIEIGGVWFLNNRMSIAPERITAANWVLQCSIATFVINMISIPYNAAIIAHERMQAFAYISLLEAALKLAIAFMLYITIFDSLIDYAIFMAIAALMIRWVYSLYCSRHFDECHLEWIFDKGLIKSMFSYSGWSFIGSSAAILRDQGVNIAMNIFCGTPVNAARGIATQVNTAIYSFCSNFMTALSPQIIKSYAEGNRQYMTTLLFQGARLGTYLLLFLSLPVIIEAPRILSIWLTVVPPYTADFVRLVLILTICESVSLPLQFANAATGRIKIYQLIVGGLQMMNFPVSYLLLMWGFSPVWTYVAAIAIAITALIARLIILNRSIQLPSWRFFIHVWGRTLIVGISCAVIPVCLYHIMEPGTLRFIAVALTTWIVSVPVILFLGCSTAERKGIISKLKGFYKSKISHNA